VPLVPKPVDGVQQRTPIERADRGHGDEVLVLPGRLLDAVEHAGRAVQRGVEADHTQGAGASGRQRARGGVGAVAEFADRREHTVPGGGPHVRMVVEDP
jgi:hypothetical protein